MTTLSAYVPSRTKRTSKSDVNEFDPDEEWKIQMKEKIKIGLDSMVQDAKENLQRELDKARVTPELRKRVEEEYKSAMSIIKQLGNDQYQAELLKEQNHRRWISGQPMQPGWSDIIVEEQQNIMNSIKQGGDQASASPDEEISEESYDHSTKCPPTQASSAGSKPIPSPSKSLRDRAPFKARRRASTAAADDSPDRPTNAQEEQDRLSISSRSERRRSDAQNMSSPGHEETTSSSTRHRRPNHEPPSLSAPWTPSEVADESDESPRHPLPRSRQPTDNPPASSSDRPWDGSLGRSTGSIRSASDRHNARSPANSENWRPTGQTADDIPPPKLLSQVNRRGSTASMRSTGSGASIRPTTETIPERIDDVAEEGSNVRDHEPEKIRKSDKAREKEKRPHVRRDSRPSPVDAGIRHDESIRSAGSSSATMHYAVSGPPIKSLSKQSSFASTEERFHPAERSTKSPPIYDPRESHLSPRDAPYSYRDQYSPREPPASAARPPPSRSPYNSEDRDYNPPSRPLPPRSPYNSDDRDYIPPARPLPPRSPFYGDDRDYVSPRDAPPSRAGVPRSSYDDREHPGARDFPNSASHPVPSRLSYSGDDRDYNGPYLPTNGRHNGSKSSFIPERDYPQGPHPPISHKSSFNYEDPRRRERDQWDRDPTRYEDRDHRDRDRDYNREPREWDREPYAEPRQPHYQPQRSATYPTAPTSANRHISQEYHPSSDVYDDRDLHRGYTYRSQPPDDYEYGNPLNARPDMPTRQPSYSRRDPPDRRLDNDPESYSRPYAYPLPDSVPRGAPLHHASNSDHVERPAWQEWASEGARPPPNDARNHVANTGRYRYGSPSDIESSDHESEPDDQSESDDEDGHDPSSSQSQSETDDGDEADEEMDPTAQARSIKLRERVQTGTRELRRLREEEIHAEEEAKKKEKEMQRKEEEAKRREEELKLKAQEAERKQEEARLKEEDAQRRADEARQKEEELKRKEEEAQRLEEEVRQKELEAARKEAEAKKKEQEAKEKEREVTKREQFAAKKAAEAGRKAEEARKKEAEVKKKEEETRRKEEKLRKEAEQTKALHDEAQKIADEAKVKQELLRQLEEETRKREEEIRERETALLKREEELKRREAEAKKKEEGAKRIAREAQEREAEAKRKEEEAEAKRREEEAEAKRKEEEAEAKRKQEEAVKREEAKIAEENRRRESETRRQDLELDSLDLDDESLKNLDPKIIEEQVYIWQQSKYRQQAENIQRNRAEQQRTRMDSIGNDSTTPSPSYTSASAGTSSSFPRPAFQSSQPPGQYNGTASTDRSSGPSWSAGGTTWTSSPKTATSASPTTARVPPTALPNKSSTSLPFQSKPRTDSAGSSSFPSGASPNAGPGLSESEWARRRSELYNSQQEQFRREQEQIKAQMQARSAGKPLTREEMIRLLERHENLWSDLPRKSELTWSDFPWPMPKRPLVPDDISSPMISAYMQSPCWPDKEKIRTPKDRIKEHIKRWHPDRFETKLLPKVIESQKDAVKQGAGNVARYLSDLLRKENESNGGGNLFRE